MEEEIKQSETKTQHKPAYLSFLLPGAIVIAAIIVSITLIFGKNLNGSKDVAQIGNAPEGQAKPADIKINANDHVLGNKDAKITIVEYSDFRCPFCERFFVQVGAQLIKDYVDTGKARFIFRHFAFLGPQSTWAAEASECANEQGKFWEFHDWLYKNQAPETDQNFYSKNNLIKYAGQLGLNTNQFASCLNSDKYSQRVADDLASGQAAGVTGTPATFINGTMIVGVKPTQPYDAFKQAIESFLK